MRASGARITTVSSPSQEILPGAKVDRYEIIELLGGGGFGAVYAARHTFLGQRVALKLLHREHMGSHDAVERFFREARAAAAIGSPHIIKVHDCGLTDDNTPFLAMELLEGRDLASLLGRGKGNTPSHQRFDLERSVDICLQVLDGLAAAHGAGIVHRDLKPANIFLASNESTDEDFVKLLDFGVSKVQLGALETALTQTGMWLGTPMYMAPEQFKDSRVVDQRADLYSAAVILYQMLSDRLPLDAETPMEAAYRATVEPPPPLQEIAPHVPLAVCRVVERGLAKDPSARWPDALSFAMALRESLSESPIQPSFGVPAAPAITQPEPGATPWTAPSQTAPAFEPYDSVTSASAAAGAQPLPTPTPMSGAAVAETPSPSVFGGGQVTETPSIAGAPKRRFGLWTALILTAALLGGAVAVIIVMLVIVGDNRGGASPDLAQQPQSPASVPIPTMPAPPYSATPQVIPQPQPPSAPSWPGTVNAAPQPSPLPQPTPNPRGGPWRGGIIENPDTPPTPQPAAPPLNPAMPQPTPNPGGRPWRGGIITDPSETPPALPPPPAPGSSPIEFGEPRIVGELDANEIVRVFELSRRGMARCRRNVPNQVRVQAHIHTSPGRVTLARPAGDNMGPEDVARCCGNAFRSAVPSGWNPGSSGIIFFDVTLQAR